jgi:hypothetical protein
LSTSIGASPSDEQIIFKNSNNAVLARVKYLLKLEDGKNICGITDEYCKTDRIIAPRQLAVVEANLERIDESKCCGGESSTTDIMHVYVVGVTTIRVNFGSSFAVCKLQKESRAV